MKDRSTGDCRAKPPTLPVVHVVFGGESPYELQAFWPVTLADDFCGGHTLPDEVRKWRVKGAGNG